jgi:hypothetical protein
MDMRDAPRRSESEHVRTLTVTNVCATAYDYPPSAQPAAAPMHPLASVVHPGLPCSAHAVAQWQYVAHHIDVGWCCSPK